MQALHMKQLQEVKVCTALCMPAAALTHQVQACMSTLGMMRIDLHAIAEHGAC